MKFSCSVDIDLPRERVIELFDNPHNLQYWQDGLVSFTHKSGIPGQVGAQSSMIYSNKGRKMEILETLTKYNLPESMHGSYEGSWGKNTMHNYFEVLDEVRTRWRADMEYLEMNGFMMKLMAKLKPSLFRKQSQKWMDQFKAWAESS